MSEFYAISKKDLSFIVRAGTRDNLISQIQEIIKKYPKWEEKYIRPGYLIIEADSTKEAIIKARENKNEEQAIYGPLFESSSISGSATQSK